jgi:large subunit ribosomal protein L31
MKKHTHPIYPEAKIECACGNIVETYCTTGSYKTDICSECHPFYTGKQKVTRVAGRVEKFNKRYGIAKDQVEE